jgi:predicted RNA-binding protein YlqC (UPF0109 family)
MFEKTQIADLLTRVAKAITHPSRHCHLRVTTTEDGNIRDGGSYIFDVLVHAGEYGKVSGKLGQNLNSLREIFRVIACKENAKLVIHLVEPETGDRYDKCDTRTEWDHEKILGLARDIVGAATLVDHKVTLEGGPLSANVLRVDLVQSDGLEEITKLALGNIFGAIGKNHGRIVTTLWNGKNIVPSLLPQ